MSACDFYFQVYFWRSAGSLFWSVTCLLPLTVLFVLFSHLSLLHPWLGLTGLIFRGALGYRQRWRSAPPPSSPTIFTANLAYSRLQNLSLNFTVIKALIWQPNINCNCCFCNDYACICFLLQCVVLYQNSHVTAWELLVCKFQIWIARETNLTANFSAMVKIMLC